MIEDIEDQIAKDEALEKAAEPTPLKPGAHPKVSNKKYKNVNGKLSATNVMEEPEPEPKQIPIPETPKQKKAKKKLSMELDEKAANIIQSRYNNDIDSLLSDGFNLSDMGMATAPKPPKEKMFLKDKVHYLARRLRSLNMELSTTYEDLEDGKI